MSTYVLKYSINAERIPAYHKFLHAGIQNDDLCMWLEVQESDLTIPNPYVFIPTGFQEVKQGWVHKATVINERAGTVWHIYHKGNM